MCMIPLSQLCLVLTINFSVADFSDFADFDNTTLTVTFQSDEDAPVNEHSVPVAIVDDDVNEAMEQDFVVVLRLSESINQESISLETRNVSLCRIIDDDCKLYNIAALKLHYSLLLVGPFSNKYRIRATILYIHRTRHSY